LPHVDIAGASQVLDQAAIGLALQIVKVSDGMRLKTWFRRVRVRDNRVQLDAHHARFRVDPSFNLRSPAF
jgi:hypothetical protein